MRIVLSVRCMGGALAIAACLAGAVSMGCKKSEPGGATECAVLCDGTTKAAVAKELRGEALADALMDQWKREHPDRAWVDAEKERHKIKPGADNSGLIKAGQAQGDTYGNPTEQDILLWARETEKFVVAGSRIFHDAQALGSTVAVSCDMCHPEAANTHPETYPKFQSQLGRAVLLRDMIDWCIEHPVRGKAMEPDDFRMRALEAYILAQRSGVKLDYNKH
jgi:thiosulfate dehydrogenase